MERAATGVPGFDKLVSGGLPSGKSVLLTGSSGTGKTTFAMQFLAHGAEKGEPGVYLTLEQKPEDIRETMAQYGIDVKKLENEGKLAIIDASLARLGKESSEKFRLSSTGFDVGPLMAYIKEVAQKVRAKRVVIDSLPSLDIVLKGDEKEDKEDKVRDAVREMIFGLQEIGLTSVLITEVTADSKNYSPHGVEEFVVDGVVVLDLNTLGTEASRTLLIRKMRFTQHSEAINTISFIRGKGIVVESGS